MNPNPIPSLYTADPNLDLKYLTLDVDAVQQAEQSTNPDALEAAIQQLENDAKADGVSSTAQSDITAFVNSLQAQFHDTDSYYDISGPLTDQNGNNPLSFNGFYSAEKDGDGTVYYLKDSSGDYYYGNAASFLSSYTGSTESDGGVARGNLLAILMA